MGLRQSPARSEVHESQDTSTFCLFPSSTFAKSTEENQINLGTPRTHHLTQLNHNPQPPKKKTFCVSPHIYISDKYVGQKQKRGFLHSSFYMPIMSCFFGSYFWEPSFHKLHPTPGTFHAVSPLPTSPRSSPAAAPAARGARAWAVDPRAPPLGGHRLGRIAGAPHQKLLDAVGLRRVF